MSYKIIVKCENIKDDEKFGRVLYINNYESATEIFKVVVQSALNQLIDPYVIEFWYDKILRYKLENIR